MELVAMLRSARPAVAALVMLIVVVPVRAADPVPAPPPRTIADFTAFLEQHRPDPSVAEHAREILKREPPSSGLRTTLGEYWLERSRAASTLGMSSEQIASLRQARTQFDRGDGRYSRVLSELSVAEFLSGNALIAVELADEVIRLNAQGRRGFAVDGEERATMIQALYRYAHPLFWAPFVVVGD